MRKLDVRRSARYLLAATATVSLAIACDRGSPTPSGGALDSGSTLSAQTRRTPMSARVDNSGRGLGFAAGGIAASASIGDAMPTAAPAPSAPGARKGGIAREGPPVEASELRIGGPITPADASGAMLIRSGRAALEVKHIDDAVTRVRQTAAQFGGFVANTSLTGGREEQRAATLEVRVPTAQFDGLLAALGGLGKVETVAASAQDVGDEYVDLGARAANARRLEARLIEMLATRTGKLSDVLTVEQELTRVREQIERYEARLKWLEKRSSFSSLEISLHEPIPLIERQPGPGPVAEAFAEAWRHAVAVLAWCIASLGVVIPVGILVGALVLLGRWIRGRFDFPEAPTA